MPAGWLFSFVAVEARSERRARLGCGLLLGHRRMVDNRR